MNLDLSRATFYSCIRALTILTVRTATPPGSGGLLQPKALGSRAVPH